TAPGRALVGDLRNEVGIDVADPDPAKSRVDWAKIVARRADAEQGQIVENGIRSKDADVATDFEGAPQRIADCAKHLTEVDARGTETDRRAGTVGVSHVRGDVIAADIDAKIGANIEAELIGADANLDRARQQAAADGIGGVVSDRPQPALNRRRIGIMIRPLLDTEEADVAFDADIDLVD